MPRGRKERKKLGGGRIWIPMAKLFAWMFSPREKEEKTKACLPACSIGMRPDSFFFPLFFSLSRPQNEEETREGPSGAVLQSHVQYVGVAVADYIKYEAPSSPAN